MVFLLLMELTSSSHTSLAGNSALLGFTLGEAIITLFAYLAHDWLRLKWIITGYFTLVLPYLYFVPESPYWLFSKKKYNQLQVHLRKIATRNGRKEQDWFPYYLQLVQDPTIAVLSTKHASRTSKEVVVHHLKRLAICAFMGFITMLLYIKISYGLGSMSKTVSPYWNIIIGAVVEGIGYISASVLITTQLGRKYSLMLFGLLTAICVLIIPFLTHRSPLWTIIVSQIGKLDHQRMRLDHVDLRSRTLLDVDTRHRERHFRFWWSSRSDSRADRRCGVGRTTHPNDVLRLFSLDRSSSLLHLFSSRNAKSFVPHGRRRREAAGDGRTFLQQRHCQRSHGAFNERFVAILGILSRSIICSKTKSNE